MRSLRQQLIFQLQNHFDGSPWYGESLMASLQQIPETTAVRKREGRSILRLLRHMLAWRNYVLQKLLGNDDFEIEFRGPADWPDDENMNWPEAMAALQENQTALLDALEQFPESKLPETVPGRAYSYAFMAEGLTQHDIYHLGQINLLAKLP